MTTNKKGGKLSLKHKASNQPLLHGNKQRCTQPAKTDAFYGHWVKTTELHRSERGDHVCSVRCFTMTKISNL